MARTPLAPSDYYDVLTRHLVPMFPGSRIQDAPVSVDIGEQVEVEDSHSLLVKPDPSWPNCFRFHSTQVFEADDVKIVKQFIRAFQEKLVASDQPFFQYLLNKCPEDVVAWSVQHRLMDDGLLPDIIAVLKRWAIETYEGHPISAAIGVDPSPDPSHISNVHLLDIANKSYTKVLSNGMDTLLVLSPSGHVVEHLSLPRVAEQPTSFTRRPFAPWRHLPLAMWSSRQRVVFALNRQGEILVFKDKKLRFAFRGGTWSHFAHASMLDRMGASTTLTRAVYASCLDISFSRTGGCIAVCSGNTSKQPSEFLNAKDFLSPPTTDKAILLHHLIGQSFPSIPRPIREEMAALDGAIVLDESGTVVAVGAIVRVPGGSDEGGRRAAAKALSRLGLAVKISADGGITAFTSRGPDEDPEIAFEVCVPSDY